ncbi:MAG: radical SAM protein [bacterium]
MKLIYKIRHKVREKIFKISEWRFKKNLEKNFETFEKNFKENLEKRRNLSIRLDLTNQCNLKCSYCHHNLPQLPDIPPKKLTKKDIEFILKDTGQYVDWIMLSCGHEPLVSNDFSEIVKFISDKHPHIKINFCTNAMLLNEEIRRLIVENQVHALIFSMDGITKETYERIRSGGKFEKVVGNILALKQLKDKMTTIFPVVNLTFVIMNSNISEAPSFIKVCKSLGINHISFQHVVETAHLDLNRETLFNYKAKFNYYRKKIIEKAEEYKTSILIPKEFITNDIWLPEKNEKISIEEILSVKPDENRSTENLNIIKKENITKENILLDRLNPFCKLSFNEIMIIEQEFIKPCPFLAGPPLGNLKDKKPLLEIFFGEEFKKVRKNMFKKDGDHRCKDCPIKNSYLPNEKDLKNHF